MQRRHSFDDGEYFKYVDVIRRPNGKLRDWEEHDILVKLENELDGSAYSYTWIDTFNRVGDKHRFLEKENEERS